MTNSQSGSKVSLSLAVLSLGALLFAGCTAQPKSSTNPPAQLAAAEQLIDAFYSYDPDRLRTAMAHAPASIPNILFYQGWAQGGNYKVLERKPCRAEKADQVSCAIKVKDDLITALGTGYDVTDTFHLNFKDGRIVGVRTSSNDPPEFDRALKWLAKERPELLTGPCRGFFDGGPTPQECVRTVINGFADFAAQRR